MAEISKEVLNNAGVVEYQPAFNDFLLKVTEKNAKGKAVSLNDPIWPQSSESICELDQHNVIEISDSNEISAWRFEKAKAYEEDYPKAVIGKYEDMTVVYAAKKLIKEQSEEHMLGWGDDAARKIDEHVVNLLLYSKNNGISPSKVLEILNEVFPSDPPYRQHDLDVKKAEVLQINDQVLKLGMASWIPENKTINNQTIAELIESKNYDNIHKNYNPEQEFNIALEQKYGEKNIRRTMAFERDAPELALKLYPELIHVYANKLAYIKYAEGRDVRDSVKLDDLLVYDNKLKQELLESYIPQAKKADIDAIKSVIASGTAEKLKPDTVSLSWEKPSLADILLRNQAMAHEFMEEKIAPNLDRFPELALYALQVKKFEEAIKGRSETERESLMQKNEQIVCKNIEHGVKPKFEYTAKELQALDEEIRSYYK